MTETIKCAFPSMGEAVPSKKSPSRPKRYKCPDEGCDKAYSRPCLLEQHMRSHSDERPFKCNHPGCDKAFLRDSHLRVHLLSHSSDKPLSCSECGKGFNTNQHLKRHIRTHFPSFYCSQEGCDASFRRHSQLEKHVSEVHLKVKPFLCPREDCGKGFTQKSRLESHINKVHSPFPRYHCGQNSCDEKFMTWSALQTHIKNEHKRVPCQLCGRYCLGPAAIAQHMKIHEQDNLIRDWDCYEKHCDGRQFVSRDALVSHYQFAHGMIPESLQMPIPGKQLKMGYSDSVSSVSTTSISLSSTEDNEAEEANIDKPTKEASIFQKITGLGYDKRNIPCKFEGCKFRFSRAYDLERHVESRHIGESITLDSQEPGEFEVTHDIITSDDVIDPMIGFS